MAERVDAALLEAAAAAKAEAKQAKHERARMADALIDLMLERQQLRNALYDLLENVDLDSAPAAVERARAILKAGEGGSLT